MRCCLNMVLAIVVVAAAIVLALGYLGFVPVVSGVFGSDKPRDLGVKPTQAEVQSAVEKAKIRFVPLQPTASPTTGATPGAATTPPAGALPGFVTSFATGMPSATGLKPSGSASVNATFTDRELTGLMSTWESNWKYQPTSGTQVKVNNDGTVEAAGILRMDRLYGYASATGVPKELVDTCLDNLKLGSANLPFYVKFTGSMANGKVSGDVQQLEIGRLPVPANLIADNKSTIVALVEERVKSYGVSVKSAGFSNGALKFDGTVPESVALEIANR
jgi:hypothetical protein